MPEGNDAGQQTADDSRVIVAVHLRPLIASELEQGSRSCLAVTPGQPQVNTTGQHQFTYDHVFGGDYGQAPPTLYTTCVAPLVESLFKGYNATVFAYGQTGSGKTYTMGSEYRPGGHRQTGVIPEVISSIFNKIAHAKDWQCSVRVSFVEIHKEEVRDLLYTHSTGARPAVSIREVMGGGVCLCGAVEREVKDVHEMAMLLETGTLCRATASTNMNNRSSRSHAIFTITLEQRRQVPDKQAGSQTPDRGVRDDEDDDDNELGAGDGGEESYLCAKMHLVDLAGSERAKRTKAEGARLKEGIHINRGLLALGNVINAIVDNHKHIPYRDSKLTRLLQDSLGGNSRTVMIACVSPADINFEESLNTLRYADRARHIRNRPTVNRDPVAAQVAHFRQQIAALKSENQALKSALAAYDGKSPSRIISPRRVSEAMGAPILPPGGQHWALVETLQQENTSLELDNTRLKLQLEEVTKELEAVKEKSYQMQASLDRLTAEVRALKGNDSGDDGVAAVAASVHDELVAGYVARIATLERELRTARHLPPVRRRHPAQSSARQTASASDDIPPSTPIAGLLGTPRSPRTMSPDQNDDNTPNSAGASLVSPGAVHEEEDEEEDPVAEEEMYYAEMAAHQLEQDKMRNELTALQRLLESKERRIAELQSGSGQVPALKQHYDRVLAELQKERDNLMSERAAVLQKLQHIQTASEEERRRLEASYKEKLSAMDDKLRSLRHKEREFVSMQKLKQRTEDLCRRLSSDITRIKQQKVQVQKMMEASAKQFAQWRQDRERELVQLRKQAQRNAAHIQALEAMQAKQNAVLQRKIADANAARKKLRELQGSTGADRAGANAGARDANGRLTAGDGQLEVQPNPAAPLLRTDRAKKDWVEKELDMCNQSYEYRRVIEGEVAQRAEATRQLKNVMKRLMATNHLTPSSPLTMGPNGVATPMAHSQVGEEVISKLNERRAQLEKQIANHNCQIAELQAAWERAKTDEEGKGGGAMDARRWTLLRTLMESREMLKIVFRVASDYKATSADRELEYHKLSEENEVLRLQLDFSKKETEQQRKRAVAAEARAATALTTPFTTSLAAVAAQRPDDTDKEVDDVLQQLQMAKTPSGLARVHEGSASGVQEALLSAAEDHDRGQRNAGSGDTATAAGSPDGSVQVSRSVSGGGTPSKAPAKKQQRGNRGSVPRDDELQGRYPMCSEDEEETENESGDDEEEDDWDPSQATPARPAQRGGRRRSGSVAAIASAGTAPPAAAGRRSRSNSVAPSDSAAAEGSQADKKEFEAQVLSHLNARRAPDNQATKVTIPVLKDGLKDWTMPNGKPWKQGSKNREQLLEDYKTFMLSEPNLPSQKGAHLMPACTTTAAATAVGSLSCPSTQPSSPRHAGGAADLPGSPNSGSSRNYRAPLVSPTHKLHPQLSHDGAMGAAPGGGSGQSTPCAVRAGPRSQGGGLQQPLSTPPASETQSGFLSSVADTPTSSTNVTPMTLMYMEKAQEARRRMVEMKQGYTPRPASSGGANGSNTPGWRPIGTRGTSPSRRLEARAQAVPTANTCWRWVSTDYLQE